MSNENAASIHAPHNGHLRKELKEKIRIMQACLDGKPIEYRVKKGVKWTESFTSNLQWAWGNMEYRIKPPKIEAWANVYPDGVVYCYGTRSKADSMSSADRLECIKLVEQQA